MAWVWKVLVTAVFALIAHRVVHVAIVTGFYKPIYNHTPGPCHLVKGIGNGSEDIVTLTSGISLITSGFQMPIHGIEEGIKGRVMTFDFRNPHNGASEVQIEAAGDFNLETFTPLGITAYEQRDKGTTTVFVINRVQGGPSVEMFDFNQEKKSLTHKKTIRSNNIYTPNNIVATSPNTFYLTNDGYSDTMSIRLFEILLLLPTGRVVYYDGTEVRPVMGNLHTPNGIALSHTRKYVYVGSILDQGIHVFEIEEDGSLSFVKLIHLGAVIDNLTVDPDTGDIWSAGQTNLMVAAWQEGRGKGCAQVLRISLDKELNPDVREVLMDNGDMLRGASVASLYQRHVLVGTVMDDLLFCQIRAF